MVKIFIFSLVICSSTMQQCLPLIEASKQFSTYRECTLFGYRYSYEYLKIYDPKLLEHNQVYTMFSCELQQPVWQLIKNK